MATIIDTLIVELGLDTRTMTVPQKAAVRQLTELEKSAAKAEKSQKQLQKAAKDSSHDIQNLSQTVTRFLAVLGGTVAIKNFISDFIEGNAQLDRLSKNLGLSVSTISAWSNATEKLGGSAQGLQSTLDMLSKSQTQLMLTGESSLLPYMSALGISLADVNGKARPVTDILLDLSDRFSHMDRTTANNMGRMLGLDQGTMNLLFQGRKELELEIRRQKEQTAVTKEQAQVAQKFQTEIVGIKQRFEALGRTLFMEAAPYLEKFLTMMEKFASWAQEHQQFIADFLKVIAVGLGAIALATLPIDLTAVAVVALAAAIALLWDDYQTWAKGGNSAFDWSGFVKLVKGAADIVRELAEGLKEAWQWWDKLVAERHKNDPNWMGIPRNPHQGMHQDPITKQWIPDPKATSAAGGAMSAQAMRDYFQKQGWTPAQAAGIASNLWNESAGNSQALGDNGAAYGVAQWHSDRQAAFKAWSGKDIRNSTVAEQLAFVQYELTKGNEKAAGDKLRNSTSAYDAGAIIAKAYERPKDLEGEAIRRGNYASVLNGVPGAASTVMNGGATASSKPTSVDRSIQTSIGQITVNTNATDADAMAHDLEHSLDYLFVSQANVGLN